MGIIPYYELFFLVLVAASLFDLMRYQVPNVLLASAFCLSLFRLFEIQKIQFVFFCFLGIIVPFILCFIFYRCRMLGASDVKLFAVIGSFAGVQRICPIMVTALFFGAAMAVVKIIFQKNFICRFRQLFYYTKSCIQKKKLLTYYDREKEGEDGVIPFTIAISLAAICWIY